MWFKGKTFCKLQSLVLLVIFFLTSIGTSAAEIPSEHIGDGKWVTLKTENGYYFYAIEEGGQIKLGQTKTAPNAENYAAYCWQIEGNATDGYTFCCLKYENPDGTATPAENKRYITNPTSLVTSSAEVLLTNNASRYYFTNNHQLQLVANTNLYLAFYSQNYHTIRLHNSANYIGSKMIIGDIFDWSVAAVVYGTETEDGEGHPQGTYLPSGGVTYGGQQYLHGSSVTLSDEALSNFTLIDIAHYRKSTIKIDRENHYIVAYYVGENVYSYLNAQAPVAGGNAVTGADNTIWSLDAVNYITNTSGNFENVPAGKAWQMEMVVENTNESGDDPSFNRWGSCILSSSSDPLNTYYWGDFQVYQHAPTHSSPNTLNFKSNKGDGADHIIAQGNSVANKNYKVIVRYNGDDVYVIRTIMLNNDLSETQDVYNNVWVAARQQNAINQMSCALPTGINLKSLRISIAEESNLLEGVDYAIQNVGTKDYLTGGSNQNGEWHSPYAGDAAKFQIEWTHSSDLTYSEQDAGLHNSFYIKVNATQYLGANNTYVNDKTYAVPFIYTTSKHIAPITAQNTLSPEWTIGVNNTWEFDFFANFYVEVTGNNSGGLKYKKNSADQTATNGQYIELPSGVLTSQMANSSQVGYMAAINKRDIRLQVQYTQLDNTFYNITEQSSSTTTLYYWYKNRQSVPSLVSYSTTNSQSGQPVDWGEMGDCSKFTIAKATTIPVKMNVVGGKYYGSVYCPNVLILPTGVKAYRLKSVSDTKFLLQEVELKGNKLPASSAVVLIKEGENPSGNWGISTEASTPLGNNLFLGTFEDIANSSSGQGTNSSIYVLGGKNSVVGFYPYSGENIPAFKAYYDAGMESGIQAFTFLYDDEETAIEHLMQDVDCDDNAVIYDLMGRRVTQMNKGGIYLMNGKKILVK